MTSGRSRTRAVLDRSWSLPKATTSPWAVRLIEPSETDRASNGGAAPFGVTHRRPFQRRMSGFLPSTPTIHTSFAAFATMSLMNVPSVFGRLRPSVHVCPSQWTTPAGPKGWEPSAETTVPPRTAHTSFAPSAKTRVRGKETFGDGTRDQARPSHRSSSELPAPECSPKPISVPPTAQAAFAETAETSSMELIPVVCGYRGEDTNFHERPSQWMNASRETVAPLVLSP